MRPWSKNGLNHEGGYKASPLSSPASREAGRLNDLAIEGDDLKMKRASYRNAIDWIAQMDSPADDGSLDPETVKELVSSALVADIFDCEPIPYAAAVERAKAWLGTRYLLARPVNVLPGLLRRQA